MSSGPLKVLSTDGRATGRRHGNGASWAFRRLVTLRLASFALVVLATATLVTPALGAEVAVRTADSASSARLGQTVAPQTVAQDETKDATDGGYTPTTRQVVFPSIALGLTQQRPIPLGVTCSCTIDRVGLVSQFDITVLQVVPDAYQMVLQLNRFNKPPRNGARYVGVYVGQQYVAGPQNQAYTTSEADWKATATDERLSDVAQLLHVDQEYRPRADVYPANYVNGWLIFELPVNRPAFMVWNYNFVGERGIWFALQ
ncbi:MAG: hypothetical protein U0893_04670 [Chloroflexota bacterium]